MEWAVNLINPEWTHLSHSMFFMLFCTSAKKTLLPKRWFVNWDPSIVLKPWVMLWQTNMQFSIGCLLCGLLHHGLAVWRKEMQDVPTCIETCSLCHQKLVNRSAIVSKFCLFGLKFPTAMFHKSNCLCMSQIRNSQEIELRCILIKIWPGPQEINYSFWTICCIARRTAHDKPSPKDPNDPNDRFFSSRLSTLLNVSTRGTQWNATQHRTSQKSAEGLSACDANRLPDELVSETWESPSWLRSNHRQNCPSLSISMQCSERKNSLQRWGSHSTLFGHILLASMLNCLRSCHLNCVM